MPTEEERKQMERGQRVLAMQAQDDDAAKRRANKDLFADLPKVLRNQLRKAAIEKHQAKGRFTEAQRKERAAEYRRKYRERMTPEQKERERALNAQNKRLAREDVKYREAENRRRRLARMTPEERKHALAMEAADKIRADVAVRKRQERYRKKKAHNRRKTLGKTKKQRKAASMERNRQKMEKKNV